MERAALARVSSALWKALKKLRSGYSCARFSLLMMRIASTCFFISSAPSSALRIFFCPSNIKGIVTIPMVSIPASLASLATTGLAPVPVPPPIPAVMNTISVLSSKRCLIFELYSSAYCRPTSGIFPAPRPGPRRILLGTGEVFRLCSSVLHNTKLT